MGKLRARQWGQWGKRVKTCQREKWENKSMSTDRLIARLMPKGNQLPRWREGKYPGHE